ncbi:MAG TPA: nitronate monooxygenase [Deltaproteobacteria bacterium]|nr:nitronate monooxygenase [Deltaproteobacteria bacterium]HPJ94453.1 nitronate monooxygenase [Deltaproteobacteria bacterium]HPR53319.1 nitronate monooxygenase [Deltaproteobacteria bacterium]
MARKVLKTRLCDMLEIEYPIVCAGMGPSLIGENTGSPVELVVAVSEAGGLGVLGGSGFTVDELRDAIHDIRSKTSKPFGVDLLLPKDVVSSKPIDMGGIKEIPLSAVLQTLPKPHQEWVKKIREELDLPEVDVMIKLDTTTMRPLEAVRVCIEEKIPLFCAGLGNPGFMVEEAHANGVKVLGITGNIKNAYRMKDAGVDLLVAQGHEAGGHTGRIGTMALLPGVLDAAGDTPVLAAGGIGDGRGLAAALAMGCEGVWVGTRFLVTDEGGALESNKERILASSDEDTRVSYAYTGKTSRTSYSKFHDLWNESGLDPLPFPVQVVVSSAIITGIVQAGRTDYLGGFGGQISGIIHEIKPARSVVDEMVSTAVDILTQKLPDRVVAR